MARVFHKHICTKGKPYKFVGWRKGKPRFVPKARGHYERELKDMGLIPVYGSDGTTVVGTTEMNTPIISDNITVDGYKIYRGPSVEVLYYAEYDEDIHIKQTHPLVDSIIRFGPLSTSLSELMEKNHYWLECRVERRQRSTHTNRPVRVYLTNGVDRYKLYSIGWSELQADGAVNGQYDLAGRIPVKLNLLRTHSSVRDVNKETTVVERIVEKTIERDPFEVLSERYPQRGKRKLTLKTMIGNRTLGERLKSAVQ
jgi:hypothetical protein